MAYPNIFTLPVADSIIERINKLKPTDQPQWGNMDVAQMHAHCCVTYEMVYTDKHKAPNPVLKFILGMMAKKYVVGEAPFKKNSQTAKPFLVTDKKQFEEEKNRLINYIKKTQELGAEHFEGKESLYFGKLNTNDWNSMFYKHLDHHLSQFGV